MGACSSGSASGSSSTEKLLALNKARASQPLLDKCPRIDASDSQVVGGPCSEDP